MLKKYNVKLLGANLKAIKRAEERDKFKKIIESSGLGVPKSGYVHSWQEAQKVIKEIGFPVIIRPSYTLGGMGGNVAYNMDEYTEFIHWGLNLSPKSQVLVVTDVRLQRKEEAEVISLIGILMTNLDDEGHTDIIEEVIEVELPARREEDASLAFDAGSNHLSLPGLHIKVDGIIEVMEVDIEAFRIQLRTEKVKIGGAEETLDVWV